MSDLRALVIGAGVMGRNHLRTFTDLPGVIPVGIVDPAVRESMVDGVVRLPDLSAGLTLDPDLVVLAAPTGLHETLGLELAAAGLPTLVEKPAASNVVGAKRLSHAFAAQGVAAAVGHVERFNPVVDAVHSVLRDGCLGQVLAVRTARMSPPPGRRIDVGVVLDLLVHDIDLACWLLDARYEEVTAHVEQVADRPCEDRAVVTGMLVTADGERIRVSHHASRMASYRERRLVVHGSRGVLVADLAAQRLEVESSAQRDVIDVVAAQPLPRELEAWTRVVRSGTPHPVLATLGDGLRAVAVAEAMLTAASAGSRVVVEEAA